MLANAMNNLFLGLAASSSVTAMPAAQAGQVAEFTPINDGQIPCPECHIDATTSLVHGHDPLATDGKLLLTGSLRGEFHPTTNIQFTTNSGAIWGGPLDTSDGAPGGYSATISDCEKLRTEMEGLPGYWTLSDFTAEIGGGLGMPLDLYTVGTCTVLVKAYVHDWPLSLGNGDVIAWVTASIDRYAVDGTTASAGNMTYGGNEYGWVIS